MTEASFLRGVVRDALGPRRATPTTSGVWPSGSALASESTPTTTTLAAMAPRETRPTKRAIETIAPSEPPRATVEARVEVLTQDGETARHVTMRAEPEHTAAVVVEAPVDDHPPESSVAEPHAATQTSTAAERQLQVSELGVDRVDVPVAEHPTSIAAEPVVTSRASMRETASVHGAGGLAPASEAELRAERGEPSRRASPRAQAVASTEPPPRAQVVASTEPPPSRELDRQAIIEAVERHSALVPRTEQLEASIVAARLGTSTPPGEASVAIPAELGEPSRTRQHAAPTANITAAPTPEPTRIRRATTTLFDLGKPSTAAETTPAASPTIQPQPQPQPPHRAVDHPAAKRPRAEPPIVRIGHIDVYVSAPEPVDTGAQRSPSTPSTWTPSFEGRFSRKF